MPDQAYHIKSRVYDGAVTAVYRATRQGDNQPVVLKILKQEYPTPEELAYFKREYEITRDIDLEGVVKVWGMEEQNGRLAMIMEDFGGESLDTLLDQDGLGIEKFLPIAIRIAEALGRIHQLNFIHKDINPSNILWNQETDQVKIIDFGLATSLPGKESFILHTNVLEGTLDYVSPEQTGRVNRPLDYRTDLYSLGVTYYEMLTGSVPFRTKDMLGLVHCHIAKEPLPPHEMNRRIPGLISNIILKLMSKNPEDRYQGAFGLQSDLERYLETRDIKGRHVYFKIGQKDIPDRFRIPRKIYGREKEIGKLLEAFGRVSNGSAEMMTVSGYTGVGKTSLINEIQGAVAEKGGYFISGRFDQFKADAPLSPMIQAFREFIQQVLIQNEEKIASWGKRIQESLRPNAAIITEVIPDLKLIIGEQPPVRKLSPADSQSRFNMVFQDFVRVIADKRHPLVMFLDDMQWADPQSLKLIEVILVKSGVKHLLVLGAYRENEVDATHPLLAAMDALKKEKVALNTVLLKPLDLLHVSQLISETLRCPASKSRVLAKLCLQKTDGNPFFLNQFLRSLYERGLINFDSNRSAWNWTIARIRNANMTDNVAELMAGRIKRLSGEAQRVLKLAAYIGSQFDLETLAAVNRKPQKDTINDLWESLQEGLILPIDENYKFIQSLRKNGEDADLPARPIRFAFLHNRVRDAAYSLYAERPDKEIHLDVGNYLLNKAGKKEKGDKVFDIAGHLNEAKDLIRSEKEKYGLIRLNLSAAMKARETHAYLSALAYLDIALELLPEDSWEKQYDLPLSLLRVRYECLHLAGKYDETEALFSEICKRARSHLDKIDFYCMRIDMYVITGKYAHAIETGRAGLRMLGIEMPGKGPRIREEVESEKGRINLNLRDKKIGELDKLPEAEDPGVAATMNLLLNLVAPCYQSNQDLLTWVAYKMVNITLGQGITDPSPIGFNTYGVLLCAVFEDFDSGFEFGRTAIRLAERLDSSYLPRAYYSFATLINHWKKHAKVSLDYGNKAYQGALETGDIFCAGYCAANIPFMMLAQGVPLDRVYRDCKKYLDFAERIRYTRGMDTIMMCRQVIKCLQGLTREAGGLSDQNFVEGEFKKKVAAYPNKIVLNYYQINKARCLFLFEDYQAALDISRESDKVIAVSMGTLLVATHYFYYALTLCALYSCARAREKGEYRKNLSSIQSRLKKWADACPENFKHKYLLVSAEVARISGEEAKPMDLYKRAVHSARKNGYIQEQALANELAAKYYLEKGFEEIAPAYMTEAYNCYGHWGAKGKTAFLKEKYSRYISTESPKSYLERSIAPPEEGSKMLDLETIIKFFQAISSEIILEKLIQKLMGIIMENAGAEKGYLILEKKGALFVEGGYSADKKGIEVSKGEPADSFEFISPAVINYAKRTKESLVLTNPSEDKVFGPDEYIVKNRPKSILCIPIVKQSRLLGLLYLENNITADAFPRNRVELLKMLSSQAAISLENAMLYKETELLNKDLQQEIREKEKAEKERQGLQKQLENSLAKVISGFIPICSNCKRIRDKNGKWNQVESYVESRSEASFSHGLCPECARKLYPEFYKDKDSD